MLKWSEHLVNVDQVYIIYYRIENTYEGLSIYHGIDVIAFKRNTKHFLFALVRYITYVGK